MFLADATVSTRWALFNYWPGLLLGFAGGSDGQVLPATWKTQVRSLGREDTLEKDVATHSSTLAWKILRTEEPDRLQSMGSQRVWHNWATSVGFYHRDTRCNPQDVLLWAASLTAQRQRCSHIQRHVSYYVIAFSLSIIPPNLKKMILTSIKEEIVLSVICSNKNI